MRNEGATNLPKPGIDQLLIESALQPELRRRLLESPDEIFRDFDLSEEEKEILRRPDHRLLPLLEQPWRARWNPLALWEKRLQFRLPLPP